MSAVLRVVRMAVLANNKNLRQIDPDRGRDSVICFAPMVPVADSICISRLEVLGECGRVRTETSGRRCLPALGALPLSVTRSEKDHADPTRIRP